MELKKVIWATNGLRPILSANTDTPSYTPLYYALELDDYDLFIQLYSAGASLTDRDANDVSALELAMQICQRGNSEFVNYILSHQNHSNHDHTSASDVAIFHLACYKGDLKLMSDFLRANFSVNSQSDFKTKEWAGATPLQFALKGHLNASEAASLLLEFDVDFYAQDRTGNTPLHSLIEIFDNRDPDSHIIDNIFKAYLRHFEPQKFVNPVNEDGLSLFHLLCSLNWDYTHEKRAKRLLKILNCFLKKGVDVNSRNQLKSGKVSEDPHYAGYTALHWAAKKCCLTIVKLLLKNGADPTVIDATGSTPLHVVEFRRLDSLKVSQLLLKRGASVDVKNIQGDTPIHSAFYYQKRNGPLMRLLLSASREVYYHTNSRGLSLLHIASSMDVDKVQTFVKNGAPVTSYITSEAGGFKGYSALHFAIAFNKVEIVEYLLDNGAEVNPSPSRYRTTPLHLACYEPLNFFYGALDRDTYEFDPHSKHLDRILQLEEDNKGSDWVTSRQDQIRIIELLLKNGAAVNDEDSHGLSPLMKTVASPCQHTQYNYSKKFRWRILSESITRQEMIMNILLDHGADVNCQDNENRTLLHLLLKKSYNSRRIKDLAEILLRRGASVDALDTNGLSPLHLAVKESTSDDDKTISSRLDTSFIDLFLAYGADVNSRCKSSNTPLHTTVDNFHPDEKRQKILAKLLTQPRIDVNAQNLVGNTPLHLAISQSKLFCVRKLLDAGANVNIENSDGLSPLCIYYNRLEEHAPYYTNDDVKIYGMIMSYVKKLMESKHFLSQKVRASFQSLLKYGVEKRAHKRKLPENV